MTTVSACTLANCHSHLQCEHEVRTRAMQLICLLISCFLHSCYRI